MGAMAEALEQLQLTAQDTATFARLTPGNSSRESSRRLLIPLAGQILRQSLHAGMPSLFTTVGSRAVQHLDAHAVPLEGDSRQRAYQHTIEGGTVPGAALTPSTPRGLERHASSLLRELLRRRSGTTAGAERVERLLALEGLFSLHELR